jgi:hypothetical protein
LLVNPSLLAVFPREERGRLELQEARQEASSLASEVSRLKGQQEDLESILEAARRETGARDAEIKVTCKVSGAAIF